MGRKKKYLTEEEIREANLLKAQRYYDRNKEVIREKNRKRYHEKK
jgi:hypothetical protein